jgi:hypothetical protein
MKCYSIPQFRISAETQTLFREVLRGLNLKPAELSRLLFNQGLKQLKSKSIEVGGYSKIAIIVRDLN